jgi:hypothetical protein
MNSYLGFFQSSFNLIFLDAVFVRKIEEIIVFKWTSIMYLHYSNYRFHIDVSIFSTKKTYASSYTYISCLDKELVKQHKLYKLYTYILYVIRDETLCLRADIHWKYSYLLDNLNT